MPPSLPAIQAVMGHKSIKIAQRYTREADEGTRRMVDSVERKAEKPVTIRSQKLLGS